MTPEQRERREELDRRIRYTKVRRTHSRSLVCSLLLLPLLAPVFVDRADALVVVALFVVAEFSLGFTVVRLLVLLRHSPADLQRPLLVPVAVVLLTAAFLVWFPLVDAVWTHWVLERADTASLVESLVALMVVSAFTVALAQSDRREVEPLRQPSAFRRAMPTSDDEGGGFSGTAIACSGGGIRAAAFSLGGLQRLRSVRSGARTVYDGADRVYGVSGGGYIATALHLARKHSTEDAQPDLFAPGSPEEDWLRRKSKFLLPSGALSTAVLSLLYGIAVNLVMIGIALVLAARYVGWVHVRLQTFCDSSSLRTRATCLDNGLPASWDLPGPGSTLAWLALLAAAVWFVATKTVSKYAPAGRLHGTRVTRALLAGGAFVAVVLGLTPWLVVHLDNAALANQPTAVVAKGLSAARLATPDGCRRAAQQSLKDEAALAYQRTPDASQATSIPVTYRACGDTWTDDAVVFAPGGVLRVPPGKQGLCAEEPTPSYCDDRAPQGAGGLSPLQTLSAWLAAIAAVSAGIRGLFKGLRGAGGSATGRLSRLALRLRSVVVPWTAAVALGVVVLGILLVQVRDALLDPGRLEHAQVLFVVLAVALVLRFTSDAFSSSLHPFYRERLSETFLVKRHDDEAVALDYGDATHVFTSGVSRGYGPELTICCAANVEDRDYIPAERGCASFRFDTGPMGEATTGRIGMSDARLPVGAAVDAQAFSARSDPQGVDTTLAAAMATSGAAFSPLVGRLNRKVRPYRVLLALANARLGVWLPNPYDVPPDGRVAGTGRLKPVWLLRRALRPGPYRILKEAFGQLSIYDVRLYVTDGGHYDNTGIVEALRDRPRTLIVFDASGDARDSLEAMSEAIVTARMDLGLVVRPADGDIEALRGHVDGSGRYVRPAQGWLHFEVATVDHPATVRCDLFLVKNVLPQVAAVEVEAYAEQHPDFPHTPTSNQFYGEYDFEAYRRLGYVNTLDMVDSKAFRYRSPGRSAASS